MLVCTEYSSKKYKIYNTKTEDVISCSQAEIDRMCAYEGMHVLGLESIRGDDLLLHQRPCEFMREQGEKRTFGVFHKGSSVYIFSGRSQVVNSVSLYIIYDGMLRGVIDNIYERAKFNNSRIYVAEDGYKYYFLELRVKTGSGDKHRCILVSLVDVASVSGEKYLYKSNWVDKSTIKKPFPEQSEVIKGTIRIYDTTIRLPRRY